jgi:Polysaccharide lyase family 8, super-sandwich domain/Polysaccharide lyase family 8, N terminal alpha-helical domain/Polysaccharide lyase family 8, C-terminal beta-sandwich domain
MKKLLVMFALLATSSAFAADLDAVRSQFVDYYTAGNADRASERMQAALGALEESAAWITAPGFLRDDGSWSDIDYVTAPDGNWGPWDHTRRLIVMARAYQTPGQRFYRDSRLLLQIDASLAYVKRFYGASIIPNGNWWFWTMGIPLDLGPTLVLMRGEVDANVVNDLVFAIHLRIGNSPASRGLVGPTPTGQNLVWSCSTHLALALLKNDESMLTAVANAMNGVAKPASGDGIKLDRSFHQHGAQLYTGFYGASFGADVAKHALITRGTPFGLSPAALTTFADYVADGIAWSLYGDYFDVSVISREVARPTTTGYQGLAALLQAAEFASPRQAEIRAAAAKMLESWRGTMPTELAGLATKIETARTAAAWPAGHRHYFASDYSVHRRNGWFASVKMFSARTKSGERTNNENILGARQSDGRFYLVLRGDEYFGRDIWPALDWSRLPGITVEQKADAASDTYGYGTRAFAGGTGDGMNGVSAMELAPLNSVLTAKKAWFFFDDAIVFLANSITSPSSNRVETVMNQWPFTNSGAQLVQGGDWMQLENVGYWIPTPQNVKTARATRTGTWASLGGSSDTTPHTKDFMTMWIDHGTNPVHATAEYAIVPNVTASQMRDWASSRPLSIVVNNERVSAVRDHRTGALGITFWSAATIEGVQSDTAAVVYMKEVGRDMHVWAADPTGTTSGSIKLTLPSPYRATITIPKNGGQTTHVVVKRQPQKKRAVR